MFMCNSRAIQPAFGAEINRVPAMNAGLHPERVWVDSGREQRRFNNPNHNCIMKPHRGTLILVLGILGLVLCAPLGIAAWIMGQGDLKQMDAGQMDPSGRSLTNAGRICGIIATILLALGIIVFLVMFALGFVGALAARG
jgi:hypothetical protein